MVFGIKWLFTNFPGRFLKVAGAIGITAGAAVALKPFAFRSEVSQGTIMFMVPIFLPKDVDSVVEGLNSAPFPGAKRRTFGMYLAEAELRRCDCVFNRHQVHV